MSISNRSYEIVTAETLLGTIILPFFNSTLVKLDQEYFSLGAILPSLAFGGNNNIDCLEKRRIRTPNFSHSLWLQLSTFYVELNNVGDFGAVCSRWFFN